MDRHGSYWTDPMVEEAFNYNKNKRKSFEQERKKKNKDVDVLMENNFDSTLQKGFKLGPTFIEFSEEENESEKNKNNSGDTTGSCIHDNFDTDAETVVTQETAITQLFEICASKKWNPPFFEQVGPPNDKMFRYKVIIKVETITTTTIECFGDSNCQKDAAQEHAAQGALWFLKQLEYNFLRIPANE